MNKWKILLLSLVLGLAACQPAPQAPISTTPPQSASPQPTAEPEELRVLTHGSFAVSEQVVKDFEAAHNARVVFIKESDAGTMLNKAILSKGAPLADVLYGVDNTFLSRSIQEDIFEPYASPVLADIPDEYKLDDQLRALPVDYGNVCLNYDKAYFAEKGLRVPQSLDDLLLPEYKSTLVVENPATSSPGLAFLLATVARFGPDGYLDYWRGLVDNDALVVNDWQMAYSTEFSGSSGKGPRPLVVSYDSSPAFEVLYADPPVTEAPTAAITAAGTCFRQIEFVGILKGARQPELARAWIDFMLSPQFQEDMPLQMFVFPVNREAKLAEAFVKHLVSPGETALIGPEEIAANREQWLKDWTAVVLR